MPKRSLSICSGQGWWENLRSGSLAYQHDRGSLLGGGEGAHCKGKLSQPWEQLPSLGLLSNHPFCSLVANNAIKLIRKTSVLNDRNSWYALRDSHQNQGAWVTKQAGSLMPQEPGHNPSRLHPPLLDQEVFSARTPGQASLQLCLAGPRAHCHPLPLALMSSHSSMRLGLGIYL